jgi:cytochrome c6
VKRKTIVMLLVLCGVSLLVLGMQETTGAAGRSGEELFKEHCAVCHPDGGNIVNPKKTLHGKDLAANKVTSEDDIMRIMRNPGPGMLTFDKKTVSDRDARAIAKYVMSTFGKR